MVGNLARTVEGSDPLNNRGVLTKVEVICKDKKASDLRAFRKTFWLPKSSIKAVLQLRESIHANRVFDIDDSDCVKHVTFDVRNVKPTYIFHKIVESLKDIGVQVEVMYSE